jgi:hypothetical protein
VYHALPARMQSLYYRVLSALGMWNATPAWQAWALYGTAFVLLTVLVSVLALHVPCSMPSIVRVRVLLIAVAAWSMVAALGVSVGWWNGYGIPMAIGTSALVVTWVVYVVRQVLGCWFHAVAALHGVDVLVSLALTAS